jgi:hypothetical protein
MLLSKLRLLDGLQSAPYVPALPKLALDRELEVRDSQSVS